jgi:hypothetical protein
MVRGHHGKSDGGGLNGFKHILNENLYVAGVRDLEKKVEYSWIFYRTLTSLFATPKKTQHLSRLGLYQICRGALNRKFLTTISQSLREGISFLLDPYMEISANNNCI